MNIEAKLTLLISEEGATIEIKDSASSITFFRGKINASDFCSAMGRLVSVPMDESKVYCLEDVGKTQEIDKLIVELPSRVGFSKDRKEVAKELSIQQCPEGWHPDLYFNSQNSFFEKDGIEYAQSTIRRWV